MRKRYTYIPNSEIESITTWNGKEIPGDKLLDGAYAKGNVQYADGGMMAKGGGVKTETKYGISAYTESNDYFRKQAELKGGIKHYAVDIDTENGENIREYEYKSYNLAKKVFDKFSAAGVVYSKYLNSDVNIDDIHLVVVYNNGESNIILSNRFNEEEEFAKGGMMMKPKTLEQKAQEMIGDSWYQMTDEQRATSIAEFVINGDIQGSSYANGGTIRDEFMYILEEHQPNVDFYETTDDLTIFSTDRDEIEAIAIYLRIPRSKIKFDFSSGSYYIQVDKDGNVMAKGGAVKESDRYIVTFMADGKKMKKGFATKQDLDDGIADIYINNLNVENINIEEVSKKPSSEPVSNVFALAKEEKKKGKKDEKERVEVKGIESDIARLNELKAIEKNAKAESDIIKGKIKEKAREKFIEKYESLGRRPENFKVYDGDEDILFIVQDNYISVSDEKADLLRQTFPELLGERVTYKIGENMLKKKGLSGKMIGEILGDLIGRCKDISEEDKANLFTIVKDIGIVDGAIEKLAEYDNVEEVYTLIQPIEALK